MKYTSLLLFILLIVSCKNTQTANKDDAEIPSIEYPAELNQVFDYHGGLDKWKSMKSLSYEIKKDEGNEKQYVDLYNRRERIEAANFTSGYDGKTYWIEADTSYKGNPKFYTNLMFYFYAMPFVLADDGIIYDKIEPLDFDDRSYPGYRISYKSDIGVSPEDEYFIHYDPETFEMAWLGYTVTFFSGEKSSKRSYIRYDDWKSFNGVKLPNSITWYKVDEGKLIEPRNTRVFENVQLSESEFSEAKFEKTNGAKTVE